MTKPKKKVKKSTKIAAQKMAQHIYDDLQRAHEAARMDAAIHGMGFLCIDSEGGMRHIHFMQLMRMAKSV